MAGGARRDHPRVALSAWFRLASKLTLGYSPFIEQFVPFGSSQSLCSAGPKDR